MEAHLDLPVFCSPTTMGMLLDVTNALRVKISDPIRRLRAAPCLLRPLVIRRADIVSVACMSKHIAIVYCPAPVYVSNVFNRDFSFAQSRFAAIELRKCHEQIYYDIAAHKT